MKFLKSNHLSSHGYSMAELLLVISIIGVISALSYPVVRNFSSANAYAEARSKAEALTAAKVLFYRSDPYAKSKWDNAQGDGPRFDLIKSFLDIDSANSSLDEYAAAPPYNAFELGDDVRNAVKLAESNTPTEETDSAGEEAVGGGSNPDDEVACSNRNGGRDNCGDRNCRGSNCRDRNSNSNGNCDPNSNRNGNRNNNGHGNNEDGVDVSNPGQGHGGPNGRVDPSGTIDDEASNGNGNRNGNRNRS